MKSALKVAAVALALCVALSIGAMFIIDGIRATRAAPAEHRESAGSMTLLSIRTQTHACLNDGVLALVELGERDIDALTQWSLNKCSYWLTHYLTDELKRPEAAAQAYVHNLVRSEVAYLAGARK